MCRLSHTWSEKYQISKPSSSHTYWREGTMWRDTRKHNNFAPIWGMRDDGVPAMQFKLLCTSPNWGPEDGILVWRQDKVGKCLLPTGKPMPCKLDPMVNVPKIIKGISGFIEYWKELCEENIIRVWGTFMNHWSHIRIAFVRPWWHLLVTSVRLWHKDFDHKVI